MHHQPITDLERFELVQAMFPNRLVDEDNDVGDEEGVIVDEFNMAPEDFDNLIDHLIQLTPVMQSPLTGGIHHVFGTVTLTDTHSRMTAAIKRKHIT